MMSYVQKIPGFIWNDNRLDSRRLYSGFIWRRSIFYVGHSFQCYWRTGRNLDLLQNNRRTINMFQKGFSALFIILVIAAIIAAGSTATYFVINENTYKDKPVPPVRYQTQEEKEAESEKMNKNPLYDGAKIANPASEYCIKAGGTLQSETRGDRGEYSICNFEDDQSCEEWALFRKQCPVGGIKTIGYDTPQEIYCAQIGGQTTATPNANCTLPGGKVCSNSDLYNGKCQ